MFGSGRALALEPLVWPSEEDDESYMQALDDFNDQAERDSDGEQGTAIEPENEWYDGHDAWHDDEPWGIDNDPWGYKFDQW